jgi:hypothetical protein
VAGYGNRLREAITAAGLPLECNPHGLRKAAGRRLAAVGRSARHIMAILGHKTLAATECYTRDADQEPLADGGIVQMEGHRGNRRAQTNPAGVGEIANSDGETEP